MDKLEQASNQVRNYREVCGLPVDSGDNANMETHRHVIMEEMKEFVDGAGDTIVTMLGHYHDTGNKDLLYKADHIYKTMELIGFDMERVMTKIYEANMSKLCRTYDEALETQKMYETNGVESYIKEVNEGTYGVFSSKDQESDSLGKSFPAGKQLKNIYWTEPDFDSSYDWITCRPIKDVLGLD